MWDNSDGGNGREKRCDHNLKAEKQQGEKNSFAECWILKLKRLYSRLYIMEKIYYFNVLNIFCSHISEYLEVAPN